MKEIRTLLVILALVALVGGSAFALPGVEYVKINGDVYESGDTLVVERGDTLDFKVKLLGVQDDSDVEVEADLLGYEYNDEKEISDSTSTFDINENETIYKTLSITIPVLADKDKYDIRLRIGGRTGPSTEELFTIKLEGPRHAIQIKDVVFSPESEIMSGRALLSSVRIKNIGEKDEESVKIKVAIPSLGISASDYLDKVEEEESITSEELYLRIPKCSTPGIYTVLISAEYDEGYEKVSAESSIRVVGDETCNVGNNVPDTPSVEKTVISVGSIVQELTAGEAGAIYPLTVTNMGSLNKVYTVSVDGVSTWGDVAVTPTSTSVLAPGETKSMYVYVNANENAAPGEKMFSVTLSSDGTVLKQVSLKANVVADDNASWTISGLKNWLQWGLIVLVVFLVLLGLIVGFNKLKGDKDDGEGQTYY